MENTILLIGCGISGITAASWLHQNHISFDWVAPNSSALEPSNKASVNRMSFSVSYSPKLSRSDYLHDQMAANILIGDLKLQNFLASRSTRLGGLGNYWGGNTAKEYTISSNVAMFDCDVIKFVDTLIPTKTSEYNFSDSVQPCDETVSDIFKELSLSMNDSISIKFYYSSLALKECLSIYDETLSWNQKFFGTSIPDLCPHNLINAVVDQIEENDKGYMVSFKYLPSLSSCSRIYSKVIICAGSIETFRIVSRLENLSEPYSFRLRHHPLATCFLWATRGGKPFNKIYSSSYYDLLVNFCSPNRSSREVFVNLIPAFPAICWSIKTKNIKILSDIIRIPFVRFLLGRLWIANFYFDESLSDSYISLGGCDERFVRIQGGYMPAFTEVSRNFRRYFFKILLKYRLLPFGYRVLPPGTDQHVSGSVSSILKDSCSRVNSRDQSSLLICPDASSDSLMPVCNPTYYSCLRICQILKDHFWVDK